MGSRLQLFQTQRPTFRFGSWWARSFPALFNGRVRFMLSSQVPPPLYWRPGEISEISHFSSLSCSDVQIERTQSKTSTFFFVCPFEQGGLYGVGCVRFAGVADRNGELRPVSKGGKLASLCQMLAARLNRTCPLSKGPVRFPLQVILNCLKKHTAGCWMFSFSKIERRRFFVSLNVNPGSDCLRWGTDWTYFADDLTNPLRKTQVKTNPNSFGIGLCGWFSQAVGRFWFWKVRDVWKSVCKRHFLSLDQNRFVRCPHPETGRVHHRFDRPEGTWSFNLEAGVASSRFCSHRQ